MNALLRQLPNAITCINLLSGVTAIIFALRGQQPVGGLQAYQWAAIFIGIGAVADFCDGLTARALKAYSNLGKELDSLCDLVTFGVAPAMLMFNALQAIGAHGWEWATLLIPLCGALRLARFNIDTRQSTDFIGLPIPANAIFWVGVTFLIHLQIYDMIAPWVWAIIIAAEAFLMVSGFRMFSLKFKSLGLKENKFRWLLIAAAIFLVVFFGVPGLAYLILFYILLSVCCY